MADKKLQDIVIEDDSVKEEAEQCCGGECDGGCDCEEEKETEEKEESEVDKLKKEIEEAVAEKDKFLNSLLKERAEFDNFRKRKNAEVSSSFQNGKLDTVQKILPVLDNLDLAISSISDEQKEDDFIKGVISLSKMFVDTLASMGVTEIDALNQPFHHDFHEAMMQKPADEGEEKNVVCQVIQKGYISGDRVIRYAKVIVTN